MLASGAGQALLLDLTRIAVGYALPFVFDSLDDSKNMACLRNKPQEVVLYGNLLFVRDSVTNILSVTNTVDGTYIYTVFDRYCRDYAKRCHRGLMGAIHCCRLCAFTVVPAPPISTQTTDFTTNCTTDFTTDCTTADSTLVKRSSAIIYVLRNCGRIEVLDDRLRRVGEICCLSTCCHDLAIVTPRANCAPHASWQRLFAVGVCHGDVRIFNMNGEIVCTIVAALLSNPGYRPLPMALAPDGRTFIIVPPEKWVYRRRPDWVNLHAVVVDTMFRRDPLSAPKRWEASRGLVLECLDVDPVAGVIYGLDGKQKRLYMWTLFGELIQTLPLPEQPVRPTAIRVIHLDDLCDALIVFNPKEDIHAIFRPISIGRPDLCGRWDYTAEVHVPAIPGPLTKAQKARVAI